MSEKAAPTMSDLVKDIDTLIAELSVDLQRAEAGPHSDTLSHYYTSLRSIRATAAGIKGNNYSVAGNKIGRVVCGDVTHNGPVTFQVGGHDGKKGGTQQ